MDPVTHITSGAIVGRAIKSKFPYRGTLILCIFSAISPDIDNIVGLLDPELYLIHHRGVTHSFAGGLVVAFTISLIFKSFSKGLIIRKAFFISYFLILLHIFLDLITSFGTQIFFPFNRTRYAVGSVFIIDPIFTSIMFILLIFSYLIKKRSSAFALTALFFIVSYPLLNLGIKVYSQKPVYEKLINENINHERITLEPELFSPFNWKVIVEHDGNYKLSRLNFFDLKKPFDFDSYKKADMGRMKILAEKASIFRTFAWFAAYPVMSSEEQGNTERIYFGDLRFYSTVPIVKKINNRNGIPFSLHANLDEDGNLVSWEYNRPGKQKVIEYVE
jgi:inner membrane protein